MKTLWALVAIFAIIIEAAAVQISTDVATSVAASKDDKVHHKRQLSNYLGGYPSYPLDFPYGPIDLGDEFNFYRSHFGGYQELPPFEVGPFGLNGLYPDVGHYANRFNYLPPPQPSPPIPPPPPPPRIPEPTINLNANPIVVDENIVGGDDVIKEVPPPNLVGNFGDIQKIPNVGNPNYINLPPPLYTNALNPYPLLRGSNEYLPPGNLNQGGYFPNYFGPGLLPTSYGLPYQPPNRPDIIPVQEPAAPEPFYVPPQLYRPAVNNPTPILATARNRTANRLVPTASVSLGSGSLGVVRLNNGQYALGSGSLGYVGNLPYQSQMYLPQLPAPQPLELYPGQRPQTFTLQQPNYEQQDQGYQRQDRQQSTSQSSNSGRNNQDSNQQQDGQPVIQISTNRHRPLFGPVQLAPSGPGGYGLGNDGRLGFVPTNLYQNLPSIQHLGEPDAINNNKYNLQPLEP